MTPEERCQVLEQELKIAQRNNRERNLALDALHFVWCSGGCGSGVHRWTPNTVTKELVEQAVRNTQRLVEWFNGSEFRTLPIVDRFEYCNRLKAMRDAAAEETPA